MEEHVLERISSLEYSINVLNKRLDSLIDTIERVAASNFIDHTMIETLTDSLESAGINLANLETEWRRRIDSRILETEEIDRLSARMQRIMEAYAGPDRKQFGLWIEKSYDLFVADKAQESVHFLTSALNHDPDNIELGLLLAEVHFQNKEYAAAARRLNHILNLDEAHFEAHFLIGLTHQRIGNLREAQKHLGLAVGLKVNSAAAHAAYGSVLAGAGKKSDALTHLSIALKLKPSAPVHFMLGAVYYDAGQHKRAIQHLRKATQLDPKFGEAF